MNKAVAIIPARMAASRYPGKPLAPIAGLPMIEHVRRRVSLCPSLAAVYVATCDPEIRDAVESFGGTVIMTSPKHERCTDRIEEAARSLSCDIVVNVQGDEPLISPVTLQALIAAVETGESEAACLIYPIRDEADLDDINTVKAVMGAAGNILYFSRSAIPNYRRGVRPPLYEQSGIMAYRKDFLHRFSRMEQTPLEKAESVDMLRILENGSSVKGIIAEPTVQVDIPGHVPLVEKVLAEDPAQKELFRKIMVSHG
jgi:3-deoxy-manno-octulosonate cytidylyltransferase (CMP-KDO synthetase)